MSKSRHGACLHGAYRLLRIRHQSKNDTNKYIIQVCRQLLPRKVPCVPVPCSRGFHPSHRGQGLFLREGTTNFKFEDILKLGQGGARE